MSLLQYLEYTLGRLLYRFRGYDAQLFTRSAAFSQHPNPTYKLTSPALGATGAHLTHEYSKSGGGKFPSLMWEKPGPEVKEWMLVIEDPDAPTLKPNVHGIFCCIPPHVTSISHDDSKIVAEREGAKKIKAGYRVGKNRRGVVYIAPRPPLGHGPHRYLFQLVGLNETLEPENISQVPTKEELERVVVGKVAGCGLWEASYEQQW